MVVNWGLDPWKTSPSASNFKVFEAEGQKFLNFWDPFEVEGSQKVWGFSRVSLKKTLKDWGEAEDNIFENFQGNSKTLKN